MNFDFTMKRLILFWILSEVEIENKKRNDFHDKSNNRRWLECAFIFDQYENDDKMHWDNNINDSNINGSGAQH